MRVFRLFAQTEIASLKPGWNFQSRLKLILHVIIKYFFVCRLHTASLYQAITTGKGRLDSMNFNKACCCTVIGWFSTAVIGALPPTRLLWYFPGY